MNAGLALTKIREKRRNGLLGLWIFERIAAVLARLGLTLHVSVIYREGEAQGPAPTLRLDNVTTGFSGPGDLAEVAQVEAYPFGVEDLEARLAEGAECFLLRHGGRVVAFTWCRFDNPPPRLGLTLGPQDAYLFDAHTAPSYRGRNLLPFLRHELYGKLRARGCTNLLSSSVAFNGPAHRFKEKLGASPLESRLYFRLFGRFERIGTLYRYPTA